MRFLVCVLGLTACGGGFVDNSPRCGNDPFDWFGGLVQHLDQGEDFAFSYNPGQSNIGKIAGGYITNNANTDFYWYTTYEDGYYLTQSTTQGIGTAYENGDVDVLYAEDVEDVLGDTWRRVVREERGGCDGRFTEIYTDDEDLDWAELQSDVLASDESTEYTIVSSDRVEYTSTYAPSDSTSRVQVGSWNSDYETEYSETWEDGQNEGTSEVFVDSDGSYRDEFWQVFQGNDGKIERLGVTLGAFDGSTVQDYTQGSPGQTPDWTIHAEYNYDGSGRATWVYSDDTVCDLVIKASGNCTYTCDNGQSGDC